ncbi:uncharacterized protein [Apostichopus japonicus]|uniref:uncharacterized protein n=1 Tax=Stichopus japonicus TaxID=307972 RepID=UPI003AB5D929
MVAESSWPERHHIPSCSFIQQSLLEVCNSSECSERFPKTGIYPLNRYIFQEHEFAAADVTDRPLPEQQQLIRPELQSENSDTVMEETDENVPDQQSTSAPTSPAGSEPTSSVGSAANTPIQQKVNQSEQSLPQGQVGLIEAGETEKQLPNSSHQVSVSADVHPPPRTEKQPANFIMPMDISPPPKAPASNTSSMKRKSTMTGAQILTSSPYKAHLTEAEHEKTLALNQKEAKKREREQKRKDKENNKRKKGPVPVMKAILRMKGRPAKKGAGRKSTVAKQLSAKFSSATAQDDEQSANKQDDT